MRRLSFVLSVLLILSGCGSRPEGQDLGSLMTSIIDRVIGDDAAAEEFSEARKLHSLDINGDGEKDVVAFFTIEGRGGGNNYSFYMSVLINKGGKFTELGTLEVGGKGSREVDFDAVSFQDGKLLLNTMEYGEADAMCCPSIKGAARFSVAGGLKEIK